MIKQYNTRQSMPELTGRSVFDVARTEDRDTVQSVLTEVRNNGWEAIQRYTQKYDGCSAKEEPVAGDLLDASWEELEQSNRRALERAKKRITRYQEKIQPRSTIVTDHGTGILGDIVRPVERVGCYIPGGQVPLPSTVLMTALIAEIAGVDELVICSPPVAEGRPHAPIEAAVSLLEEVELFGIGGIQAIGAMTYGAGSIEPVDLIVGPGNLYVTLAKKEVFGTVDIDMLAGPSEIAIIADPDSTRSKYVAADLMSQAEHDPNSRVYLFSSDQSFIDRTLSDLEDMVVKHPRRDAVEMAFENSAVVETRSHTEAIDMVNTLAPEHLELQIPKARKRARDCRHAGAIFAGKYSPEPVGDYMAGPSHTLPTGGSARFFSPLSVHTFYKHQSMISLNSKGYEDIAEDTVNIANLESLPAHARSAQSRTEETNKNG